MNATWMLIVVMLLPHSVSMPLEPIHVIAYKDLTKLLVESVHVRFFIMVVNCND